MLFNSIEFAIFLPLMLVLYWFVINTNLKRQNFLLLIASYVFYGWWDWRFLTLIIFSSFVDYAVGLGLHKTDQQRKRKLLLLTSIFVNLGFLAVFKYFNFFSQSFADAFTLLGRPIDSVRLNIILPVGISFYTFQTLSYSIDVYKRKLEPTQDIVAFFAFVSFFPQLVAGPIERAANLLPQFYTKRTYDHSKALDGVQQILWGLFKKIVIADNCATFANQIFAEYQTLSGSTLVLGSVFFAFQIYGDFSGYSDIAIGTARLFGFDLMRNFAFPYFSRDIAEFWRRWHISLSSWFRDYVYFPLGGSHGNTWSKVRNTFIIFIVSGFWHGANWTFIIWGMINACYFLPLMLLKQNRKNTDMVAQGKLLPSLTDAAQMALTFSLTLIAWIFFRAKNVTAAVNYLAGIFSASLFTVPSIFPIDLLVIIACFILFEWVNREKQHPLSIASNESTQWEMIMQHIASSIIIWSMILWGVYENKEFIVYNMPFISLLEYPDLFAEADKSIASFFNEHESVSYINGREKFKGEKSSTYMLSKYDMHANEQAHVRFAQDVFEIINKIHTQCTSGNRNVTAVDTTDPLNKARHNR